MEIKIKCNVVNALKFTCISSSLNRFVHFDNFDTSVVFIGLRCFPCFVGLTTKVGARWQQLAFGCRARFVVPGIACDY